MQANWSSWRVGAGGAREVQEQANRSSWSTGTGEARNRKTRMHAGMAEGQDQVQMKEWINLTRLRAMGIKRDRPVQDG